MPDEIVTEGELKIVRDWEWSELWVGEVEIERTVEKQFNGSWDEHEKRPSVLRFPGRYRLTLTKVEE